MEIVKKSNFIGDNLEDKDRAIEYFNNLDDDIQHLMLFSQGRVRFGTPSDGNNGENMSGQWQVVADTGNADTEFTVAHTIGAVPIGFLVTNIDKGAVIYDSGTAWTSTNIYLKSTVANTAVTLFLLK